MKENKKTMIRIWIVLFTLIFVKLSMTWIDNSYKIKGFWYKYSDIVIKWYWIITIGVLLLLGILATALYIHERRECNE